MPYFGRWPIWMPFFLASCRANSTMDWLFFSDCGQLEHCPPNVKVVETSYSAYCALIAQKLDMDFCPEDPYKLCDLKPALGCIHEDYLKGYDFWAFGDIDVIYGRLREFFTADRLRRFDLISNHARRISGHLTLIRNTQKMCQAFRLIPDWQKRFCGPHQALDEGAFSRIFLWRKNFPKPLFKFAGLFNPWRRKSDFQESFSTPNAGLPWTDGRRIFPENWHWREGHLSNDMDGEREFPYFHFFAWKRNWKNPLPDLYVKYEELAKHNEWWISEEGFFVESPDENPFSCTK